MNTKTRFGVLVGIIAILIAFMIYGEHRFRKAREVADQYENALAAEELETNSKDRMLRDKNTEIDELKEQNKILKDSIEVLQEEIGKLSTILGQQGRELLANTKKMKAMQMREDSLVKEIKRMMADKSTTTAQIEVLENERLFVNKGMAELYERNDYLKDSIANATLEKEAIKEKLTFQEQILEISNNTIVKFNKVKALRDNGKDARRPSTWKVTEIDLELFHPKGDIIKNEVFIVVLKDLDRNIPIPPRESNAGIDRQGESFTFVGNPIKTIRYPNYQEKESKNYAFEVYYVKNGSKYPLSKGGLQQISFK